jgi:hypothetical protein
MSIKYKEVFQTVNDDKVAAVIATEVALLSEESMRASAIEDENVGRIIFFQSDKHPSVTAEIIGGVIASDCIIALYQNNGIFSERAKYIDLRLDLIKSVARVFGAGDSFGQVAIQDPARKRQVLLSEIATAQLIDLLEDSGRRIEMPS